MKRFTALSGLLLVVLASGCFYELRDEFTECKISCRNRWAAKAAWWDTRKSCQGINCPHSFKDGFMAGYLAVADGGTGCPPAVPIIECHNHMWLDHCSDSQKMESWYDGYEIGAIAARESGMADWNRITTRTPHATPIDYSMSGHSHSNSSPILSPTESTFPPSPDTDEDFLGGPQTSR